MKKASILYILFLVVVFSVSAQKLKKSEEIIKEPEPKVNIDSLAQQLAINVGDYNHAITFGYRLLAQEPENLTKVFQLAQLYYAAQNYEMSLRFSTIVANKDSLKKQSAMELAALNLLGLKANDKAIELYKVMSKEFNHPSYLYEASVLEYQTKKHDDCVATLNMVLKDTIAQNQTIVMSRKNAVEKVIKEEINLIAASLNILGVVSLEKENYTEAKKYFSNALAIQPNFILAENNLKEVVKKEEDTEVKKKLPKKSD
ncbi:MAG: tetratricopeptide repeat protein [Flavobacteriales bacterium]